MANTLPTRPRSSWLQWLFWIFLFFLIGTTSAILGAITALIAPEEPEIVSQIFDYNNLGTLWQKRFEYQLSRPVNILVMGIDWMPGASADAAKIFEGRSDTMLLLQIYPADNTVSLLSIPRDTLVPIPGVGRVRINEANVVGGPKLVEKVLKNTLNDVDIDRYVRVSSGAFRELVDLLGGVEVFVPEAMSYTDNTQRLKIDLAAGWQTLNGEQAEQFARFRDRDYGDIGRIQRQQFLLAALRERITSPAVLASLPQILRIMQKYVDTNLSFEEMLALANFGLQLDEDDLKMVMLPGRPSEAGEYYASYWIMDLAGRDRVMRQYFNVNSANFIYDRLYVSSTYNLLPKDAKIAVQNASSDRDLAKRVADYLREQGYYNVYVAPDWSDREILTRVIVQRGDLQAAEILNDTLGLGKVEAASIGEIGSDLTIRLGENSTNKF